MESTKADARKGVTPAVAVTCPQCGEEAAADQRFCRHCGAGLDAVTADVSQASDKSSSEEATEPLSKTKDAKGSGKKAPPPPTPPFAQAPNSAGNGHATPTPPPASAPPQMPPGAIPTQPPPGFVAPQYMQDPTTGVHYVAQPVAQPAFIPGQVPAAPPTGGYVLMPTQQPEEKKTSQGLLIGGTAAAILAVIGLGVGLFFALSGGSSHAPHLVAAPAAANSLVSPTSPPASEPSNAGSGGSGSGHASGAPAPTHHAAPVHHHHAYAASSGGGNDDAAISSTIQRHFNLIQNHEFSAAYALLAPSAQTGESSWVSQHQADGIQSVSVSVTPHVTGSSSGTATIDSMITHDNSGCQSWSGSWDMTKIGGEWRIAHANLSSSRC